MIGQVSAVAIAGVIFSAVISIGLPIVLLILAKKKLHAKMSALGIGMLTFVLFALGLEQVLHSIMLNVFGDALTGNVWLYALYGGLAAGVFEETGRYVAMKFWMEKTLTKENSVMYGVGHGGVEAVLIVGFTCISNLITMFMINSGQLEKSLSVVEDGAGKELAIQSISVLWTTPGYQFFLAGVERIAAIALHLCLSYLVYRAVKYGAKKYYFLALGVHFLVNALTLLLKEYLPMAVLEILLVAAVAAFAVAVRRMYGAEKPVCGDYR